MWIFQCWSTKWRIHYCEKCIVDSSLVFYLSTVCATIVCTNLIRLQLDLFVGRTSRDPVHTEISVLKCIENFLFLFRSTSLVLYLKKSSKYVSYSSKHSKQIKVIFSTFQHENIPGSDVTWHMKFSRTQIESVLYACILFRPPNLLLLNSSGCLYFHTFSWIFLMVRSKGAYIQCIFLSDVRSFTFHQKISRFYLTNQLKKIVFAFYNYWNFLSCWRFGRPWRNLMCPSHKRSFDVTLNSIISNIALQPRG